MQMLLAEIKLKLCWQTMQLGQLTIIVHCACLSTSLCYGDRISKCIQRKTFVFVVDFKVILIYFMEKLPKFLDVNPRFSTFSDVLFKQKSLNYDLFFTNIYSQYSASSVVIFMPVQKKSKHTFISWIKIENVTKLPLCIS